MKIKQAIMAAAVSVAFASPVMAGTGEGDPTTHVNPETGKPKAEYVVADHGHDMSGDATK